MRRPATESVHRCRVLRSVGDVAWSGDERLGRFEPGAVGGGRLVPAPERRKCRAELPSGVAHAAKVRPGEQRQCSTPRGHRFVGCAAAVLKPSEPEHGPSPSHRWDRGVVGDVDRTLDEGGQCGVVRRRLVVALIDVGHQEREKVELRVAGDLRRRFVSMVDDGAICGLGLGPRRLAKGGQSLERGATVHHRVRPVLDVALRRAVCMCLVAQVPRAAERLRIVVARHEHQHLREVGADQRGEVWRARLVDPPEHVLEQRLRLARARERLRQSLARSLFLRSPGGPPARGDLPAAESAPVGSPWRRAARCSSRRPLCALR